MQPITIAVFVALLAHTSVLAFDLPPNDGFVTDTVNVLTEQQESSLESRLSAYRKETSNEIAVLIVDSTEGEPIADIAIDAGREWGVGSKENDNGIFMLIAYSDRELFIATGYGLEGAVPDIVAKGIVEEEILPQFRDGQYYEGVVAGVDALEKHIGGEYTADRYDGRVGASPDFILFLFFLFAVLIQWIVAILARTKSWWLGGVLGAVIGVVLVLIFTWWISIPILTGLGLLIDYGVSKNYKKRGKTSWWAGGGWGPGGGSGGFGGFSGGSFGGGGAGGSW